jgi:hypothetical protein
MQVKQRTELRYYAILGELGAVVGKFSVTTQTDSDASMSANMVPYPRRARRASISFVRTCGYAGAKPHEVRKGRKEYLSSHSYREDTPLRGLELFAFESDRLF